MVNGPTTPATLLAEPTPAWFAQAECRGLDANLFHPRRGDPCDKARAVCAVCPVSAECLDYAITLGFTNGMWGGKSERQRRVIRRNLAEAS